MNITWLRSRFCAARSVGVISSLTRGLFSARECQFESSSWVNSFIPRTAVVASADYRVKVSHMVLYTLIGAHVADNNIATVPLSV